MIETVHYVLDWEENIIGLEFKVQDSEEKMFFSTNQGAWPKLRYGEFPRDHDPQTLSMKTFNKEQAWPPRK